MSVSSVSNSTNTISDGRYWGILSQQGLDVPTIIKGLTSDIQNKIDSADQSEQKLQWQQSAYQDIINGLTKFQQTYLSIGSPTCMLSSDMYRSFSSSVTSSTGGATGVTISTNSDAISGSHTLEIDQSAKVASITGGQIGGQIVGTMDASSAASILRSYAQTAEANGLSDPSISVTVDGVTKNITFAGTDNYTDIVSLINGKLKTAFGVDGSGNAKVIAATNGSGKLTLSSNGGYNSNISISGSPSAFNVHMLGSLVDAANTAGAAAPSITLKVNTGVVGGDGNVVQNTQTISFTSADGLDAGTLTNDDYQALINRKLQSAFGNDASGNQIVTAKVASDGSVQFVQENLDSHQNPVRDANNNITTSSLWPSYSDFARMDPTTAIGIKSGATNRMNTSSTLSSLGLTGDTVINVNGKSVTLTDNMTVGSAFSKISNAGANVRMTYSADTDRTSVTATQGGLAGNFSMSGSNSNGVTFLNDILGTGTARSSTDGNENSGAQAGRDAVVMIDGTKYSRSSNNFLISGISYTITQTVNTDAPLNDTINISSDTSSTETGIKNFLSAYNTLLESIYSAINTSPLKDPSYAPLTDAQKDEMTQEQIDAWNKKAQVGVLFNDDTLSDLTDTLESVEYQSVTTSSGRTISLYDIGITTDPLDYTKGGELFISPENEQKFENALAQDPQAVQDLFMKSSNILYSLDTSTTDKQTAQSQRISQEGVMNRINDIVNNYIYPQTGNLEGKLTQIAGISGDRSQGTNQITKQLDDLNNSITTYKSQLKDKQTTLYNKFARLETYLEQADAQSAWLSSAFGSGS